MNTEEFFLSTKAIFEKQAQEAMEAVMSKMYDDYLPHVESDTSYNVNQQAENMLQDFLAGRDSYRTKNFITHVYAADVRKAIFEQFRHEIEVELFKDMQNEISNLKASLEAAYRSY